MLKHLIMNKNNLFKSLLAVMAVAVSFLASAGNVGIDDARQVASNFIHQQAAIGTFKAARSIKAADLMLAHAEASQAVANANDYYAFNVADGGWVIVAGEDRATSVLGYSNHGRLDFDRLPCTFKALLDSYKREIEFLQTYTADDLVQAAAPTASAGVGPLITSTWGQELPYYLQCPVYNQEYCVVGCVATAMAQVMNYWQYPQSCNGVASFYCQNIGKTLKALPATTFDYSLLLDSYCHWDWDNSTLVQDTYTEAQAQEVAKLSRYCGQAVQMGYSPEGSGAYTDDQLEAMKNFGYRSTAEYVTRDWYGYSYYTKAEWEAMIKEELDAGRPILYAANDPDAGGHAFICDGYDGNGKFHFNMGWYGTCDGWYASTALNMTHRDGDALRFNSGHEMLLGVEPPEGWVRPTHLATGDLNGDGNVDVIDAGLLIDIVLDKDVPLADGAQTDINGDNLIDVNDVSALIDIILGK